MKAGIKRVWEASWHYRAARVVHVANSVGIFDVLAPQELSAADIARRCQTKPEMTEKLLIACAAFGLLEKRGDHYANTELADQHLVPGRPLYQGDMIAHDAGCWDFWNGLESELRRQPPPPVDPAVQHKSFIMGMHNISLGGRGQVFLDHIDLSGRQRLFDVGGGPGTYSILACRKYPELTAVVFDLPETIAIAREVIAREGMTDRVTVREGNWDEDSFGPGHDAVLFSNVLHGPTSGAADKLRKAYDSMTPGALLIVQEFLLNDEKTGPLIPALFNIMVGAYSGAELIAEIEAAGFRNPHHVPTPEQPDGNWVTAEKPRTGPPAR